jgi:steroid delta-isomerase-like uncharacterized protein
VARVYEMINSGDTSGMDSVLAADAVDHEEMPGIEGTARERFAAFIGIFRTAFPDIKMTADDVVADGDMVAVRYTVRGTHQGELLGIPATGRRVEVGGFDLMRFENGVIAEHWGLSDSMAMMQQLGVIPGA